MKEKITTMKVWESDKDFLLKIKKKKNLDSLRSVINHTIKVIKYHKLEEEI